jgi:predicted DNA binding protein
VTGEDLAESFDISSPAVYNHLQAAHRTLLETVFGPADSFRF